MATPIGYTPQFVQTDLGLIGQTLAQRDAEYNTALQQQQAVEDAFASYQVDPRDIELKNQILGGVQSEAQKIVDRYGGDYAAASSDLTRLATRTKKDPFFTLAGERRRLAEEERQRMRDLGPLAIQTKSVRDIDLMDKETGEYISPDQLNYEVLDRSQIEKAIQTQYGQLAKQTREEVGPSRFPGYFTARTFKGIKEGEIADTSTSMKEYIKSLHPNIPDEVAENISLNSATQMNLGHDDQYIHDTVGAAAAKAAAKLKAGKFLTHRTSNVFKNDNVGDKDLLDIKFNPDGSYKPKIGTFTPSLLASGQFTGPTGEQVKAYDESVRKQSDKYHSMITDKIAGIKQSFPELSGMTDKEAVVSYNKAVENYSAQSFVISEPSTPAKELLKDRVASNAVNSTFYLKDGSGKTIDGTLETVVDELGYSNEQELMNALETSGKVSGWTNAGGPVAGAISIQIPDDDGKLRRLMVSPDEDFGRMAELSFKLKSKADLMQPDRVEHNGVIFDIMPVIMGDRVEHIISTGVADQNGNFIPSGERYTLADIDKITEDNILNSSYLGTALTETKLRSGE